MPIIYQDRAGISLYEARSSSAGAVPGPIPDPTVQQVVARLAHFKTVCADFGVPLDNVHVLATEATRTAPNSEEFRKRIEDQTGWKVELLSKEDEGRLGAMGVASSSASTSGLVMDMGGGSVQITWLTEERRGAVTTCPRGSFSFPYGAAALSARLDEMKKGSKAREELKAEIIKNFQHAYKKLQIPASLVEAAQARGGFDLYLCGGGFRGWGYVLMAQSKIDAYPIPIVNGFRVSRGDFYNTSAVLKTVSNEETRIFGVSKRRASQIPAVAFLVNAVVEALPMINTIQFCQGGVREGFLYDRLPVETKAQEPLLVATSRYAPRSVNAIRELLIAALPSSSSCLAAAGPPELFSSSSPVLAAISDLLFAHSPVHRESRPAAALHSTTTGILAYANSIAHVDRAALALVLAERWSGDLPQAEQVFQQRLCRVLSAQEAWWCQYVGRVAALIGTVYPSGVVPEGEWRVRFETHWDVETKKKGRTDVLCLKIVVNNTCKLNGEMMRNSLRDLGEKIEKIGKKKNWVESMEEESRYGVRIGVNII